MQPATESVVAGTDFLLALAAFAGSFALFRDGRGPRRGSLRLWAAGFAAIGLSAVLGGTWHAAHDRLPPGTEAGLWSATLAAAGFAGFLLLAGASLATLSPPFARLVAAAGVVKLAVFLARSTAGGAFAPVVADSAATLATIFVFHAYAFARRREASAPSIFAGIGLSAAAAAIEGFRPRLPAPFGPDAVYHLVQTFALYYFYRGGKRFRDR